MNRILHFGIGNFHRAHQAWYTHQANAEDGPDWSITGVSLRSPAIRDRLAPQNFNYTLVIRDAVGESLEQVSVIDDILFASEMTKAAMFEDPSPSARILEAAYNAEIITLSVTEKGYHLGPDGKLDLDHPNIQADLAGIPTTIYYYLFHALHLRQTPVTIISCDNLTANGDTLRDAVQRFAEAKDLHLWAKASFPNTMVDRITPATTDMLRDHARAKGMPCAVPVETESFSEWVIEDKFAGPRPAWDKVGVQIVDDARPYELRKLRMLNGAHSALAYGGLLAGYDYVHQAVADPELRAMIEGIFEEAAATLPKIETHAYRAALQERFANPNLNHSLRQIAMDGSQKLPVRLLGTIADYRGRAEACHRAVAAWIRFAQAEVEAGRALDDPKAAAIAEACTSRHPAKALAQIIGYTG